VAATKDVVIFLALQIESQGRAAVVDGDERDPWLLRWKTPTMGGFRWWARKRAMNLGSVMSRSQRLQTLKARGRENLCGARQRRISWRRSSSSSGVADLLQLMAAVGDAGWGCKDSE
jgi:hypothetical protein